MPHSRSMFFSLSWIDEQKWWVVSLASFLVLVLVVVSLNVQYQACWASMLSWHHPISCWKFLLEIQFNNSCHIVILLCNTGPLLRSSQCWSRRESCFPPQHISLHPTLIHCLSHNSAGSISHSSANSGVWSISSKKFLDSPLIVPAMFVSVNHFIVDGRKIIIIDQMVLWGIWFCCWIKGISLPCCSFESKT